MDSLPDLVGATGRDRVFSAPPTLTVTVPDFIDPSVIISRCYTRRLLTLSSESHGFPPARYPAAYSDPHCRPLTA